MGELRCARCDCWLGESAEPLVHVDTVTKGYDVTLAPPRDLRLCKSCGRVNVFVPRRSLTAAQRPA
ncbi:hypothetical protein [Candidatus Palauibacter sp.]|uniref:hypothetical protein n=1 Tax=Candidatus Palauibacter sp. TaxID=3101350 RepID=UPI003CC5AAFB